MTTGVSEGETDTVTIRVGETPDSWLSGRAIVAPQ